MSLQSFGITNIFALTIIIPEGRPYYKDQRDPTRIQYIYRVDRFEKK